MKTLKNILLLALLFSAGQLNAQTDKATTARIIKEQHYIFIATSANPLNASDINKIMSRMPGYSGGGSINLNSSNYDLTVTPDSLISYLPYYGRSYTPKIGGAIDDTGIKFKSKDFRYKIVPRKKGGWYITMTPKDVKDNYNLSLFVTDSGYATLTVNNSTQQAISFDGYLSEPKQPKK